jgi:hypothetical protein
MCWPSASSSSSTMLPASRRATMGEVPFAGLGYQ